MKYSTKNSPTRIWHSAKKLIWLAFRAFILGGLITGLYAVLRHFGVFFIHSSEGNLNTDITNWAVLYNLFAAVTVALVVDKFPKLSKAVLKRDKEAFLLLRDEKLSLSLNLITGTIAFILLYMMGCRDYETFTGGMVSISTMGFVMSLIFIGVQELQDVSRSPWFKERVPPDWWTVNIDDFFLGPTPTPAIKPVTLPVSRSPLESVQWPFKAPPAPPASIQDDAVRYKKPTIIMPVTPRQKALNPGVEIGFPSNATACVDGKIQNVGGPGWLLFRSRKVLRMEIQAMPDTSRVELTAFFANGTFKSDFISASHCIDWLESSARFNQALVSIKNPDGGIIRSWIPDKRSRTESYELRQDNPV